jgi:hypothetical protein
MTKQTAVEWLVEQYYESEGKLTRYEFEQAKAMEDEQMKEMYLKGIANYDSTFKGGDK